MNKDLALDHLLVLGGVCQFNRRQAAAFSDVSHIRLIFLSIPTTIMQAFTCQRCKQPLRIDDSLADLDSASADLLTGKLLLPPRT